MSEEDIPIDYTESFRSSLQFIEEAPLMGVNPHIRPAPQYQSNTSVEEDEEDRPANLKWDLLRPAFMVVFHKRSETQDSEKCICLGLALQSSLELTLKAILPSHLVLMSLEFFSLDKSEYIGKALGFEPFEFIARRGSVPNVQVLEYGEERELHLENETHQFEYSLTKQGTWRISLKPKQ